MLDSIIIRSADVTYDLFVRRGTTDMPLATWTKRWEAIPQNFDAQAYEVDMTAPAVSFAPGDQLIFRYTAANTINEVAYVPNGDGFLSNGRIPNITLPD